MEEHLGRISVGKTYASYDSLEMKRIPFKRAAIEKHMYMLF